MSLSRSSLASPADLAACRLAIRTGSRSFFAASLLLPRTVFEPALALYAFCRAADDAIDAGDAADAALDLLYRRLDRVYAGRPDDFVVDRALADVVAEHGIPFALPAALLEGFGWDASRRRYETLDALQDYAARVAGTVGAMMAMLMGTRDRDTIARACELGLAMQLSNIARDVGEDARAGRLYLPLAWLREAGIDPDACVGHPIPDERWHGVVRRLLAAADTFYARADFGVARLPLVCRPGIATARLLYAEIGRQVERLGCESLSRRAVVPGPRKLRLMMSAVAASWRAVPPLAIDPVPATRFLIDAVAAAPQHAASRRRGARQAFDDRAAWLADLFARLAQDAQAERDGMEMRAP